MKLVIPPKQDEANAILKSLYVCEAKGCGYVHERKAKFCKDHATPADRIEVEKEWAERNQSSQ